MRNQTQTILRSFLFALIALVATVVQAKECYPPPFIERIGPALNLTDADRANGFHVKFRGSLDQLNELVNEGRARSINGPGKEPVYRTLVEALKNVDRKTTFIIAIGGGHGEVVAVWTAKGEPLIEYRAKCLCCGTKYVLTP